LILHCKTECSVNLVMKKKQHPQLYIESGSRGTVGVLRDLRQIQLSVPDKYFFVNKYRKKESAGKKKDGKGLFSRISKGSVEKSPKLDINQAVEQVKSFHNSFQVKSGGVQKTSEAGVMNVSAMNAFRKEIKDAASVTDADVRWIALDAIVTFIDLKNSGLGKEKRLIQQDCLRKIGEALHRDGGLSMFNTTWFLTIYKDYLSGFKMFRTGELENINRQGDQEAKNILKKLQRKQFEIPVYMQLVDSKQPDIKLLLKYSKFGSVKNSKHGQRGCTSQDIKRIFTDQFKVAEGEPAKTGGFSEVNIIMSYVMFLARIPMMYEVVETIKSAIPKISIETKLYQQKITITQKSVLLDLASALYQGDKAKESSRKLYLMAKSVYKYCLGVISDHRLNNKKLLSTVFTYPLMKQAALLIIHQKIFSKEKDAYLDMLKQAVEFLEPVRQCSSSGDQGLIKIAGYAEIYQKKLEMIEHQVRTPD